MANPSVKVSDNFQRPDGPLGGAFGPVVGIGTPAGGIRVFNDAFTANPPGQSGGNAVSVYSGSYGNDQYAGAQIKAIQGFRSTLTIDSATQVGGNTTYHYTLVEGEDPIVPQAMFITGMGNAGNNSPDGLVFVTTAVNTTAKTFTVANASGVTAIGQSGTSISATDAINGLVVRGTQDGLNGYIFLAGTNNGVFASTNDSRVYCGELWTRVNGLFSFVASIDQPVEAIPDSVGDYYGLSVTGSIITAFKNGVVLLQITDTQLTGGAPGIYTEANGGPNEYISESASSYDGFSGTQWTNWVAGDFPAVFDTPVTDTLTGGPVVAQQVADSFAYSNGDLHTVAPNYTYQAGTLQVNNNKVFASAGAISSAYRGDITVGNDQYVEAVATIGGNAATQNCGPALRMTKSATQSFYGLQYANNVLRIAKCIAGSFSVLATADGNPPVNGDVLRLYAVGTLLVCTKNGVFVTAVHDSSLTSGAIGLWGVGNATINGQSALRGGNVTALVAAKFTQLGNPAFFSDNSGTFPLCDLNASSVMYDNSQTYTPDQFSQATNTSTSYGSMNEQGPAVRVSTDGLSLYQVGIYLGISIYLEKIVGGTGSVLNNVDGLTLSSGDVVRLEAIGPLLVVKLNGAVIMTSVDFDVTEGAAGMYASSPGMPLQGSWTSWSGGNITVAQGNPDDTALSFLGSVSETVDASLPGTYVGHVRVIAAPRAGAPNPYLGKMFKLTSAPAGLGDPLIGEVVIVSGPPSGFQGNDTYLGHVEET